MTEADPRCEDRGGGELGPDPEAEPEVPVSGISAGENSSRRTVTCLRLRVSGSESRVLNIYVREEPPGGCARTHDTHRHTYYMKYMSLTHTPRTLPHTLIPNVRALSCIEIDTAVATSHLDLPLAFCKTCKRVSIKAQQWNTVSSTQYPALIRSHPMTM